MANKMHSKTCRKFRYRSETGELQLHRHLRHVRESNSTFYRQLIPVSKGFSLSRSICTCEESRTTCTRSGCGRVYPFRWKAWPYWMSFKAGLGWLVFLICWTISILDSLWPWSICFRPLVWLCSPFSLMSSSFEFDLREEEKSEFQKGSLWQWEVLQ